MLIAGTLTTFFILDFRFLWQWQRPDEPEHLTAESSMELHFRLKEEEERGGRPAEDWERFVIWKPEDMDCCMLSVSPVREDMNEFAGEAALVPDAKLMVVAGSFLSIELVFK
jgi:hypothetical protein